MSLVSIVCPVYNEEESLSEFYDRTTAVMSGLDVDYELIFIDNASTDTTASMVRKLADDDKHVSFIQFSRNFGHQMSITAGIDHARGDAVVIIDTDLQDPPEVIAEMIDRWREGFEVVYGQRTARPGESAFKRATARSFYRIINWMSDVALPLDVGEFRLMDRKVVEVLRTIREENRYMRGLVSWVGFNQYALQYERDVRFAGETKYPIKTLFRFAFDGITSFSEKPLRVSSLLGMFTTGIALLAAIAVVIGKIINPSADPGYASLMVVILFFGGVQLLTIGILGQYLGRTYRETKNRPLYVVADKVNVG